MTQRQITVMITAIGGIGYGQQILKALRMAPCHRYRLIGADIDQGCPQQQLVDSFIALPLAVDSTYLESLLRVCQEESVDVLFAGCDPELRIISRHRTKFLDRGIYLPMQEEGLIDLCLNKYKTAMRLEELRWPHPESELIHGLDTSVWTRGYPVVLKPAADSVGSAGVYIAQTASELKALTQFLRLDRDDSSYLLQEYIGDPDSEYTVGILHDAGGEHISSIGVRRRLSGSLSVRLDYANRTSRPELGTRLVISSGVSQGDVGRFDSVTSQCRQLAELLGSRGPLNIQCRVVDGDVWVFEINPRLSGTTAMRAIAGCNEPDMQIRRHIFGEHCEPSIVKGETTILRSLCETVVS
jgi:carbamoyl-phosphate synthase large subunit